MKDKELSFEDNLKQLEVLVKELENGNVPLDEAITKFNEATILAKKCDEKLKKAEEMVSKILNDDGTLSDFNPGE